MAILATTWEPGLNPIGPSSMFALGAAAAAWLLADWKKLSRLSPAIILVCLAIFGTFLVLSAANLVALAPLNLRIKYRRFPDFDDYLANYILLAVGLVLCLKLARMRGWTRYIGVVLAVVFGAALLAEFCGGIFYYGS